MPFEARKTSFTVFLLSYELYNLIMSWRALQHVNTSTYISYQPETTQIKFFRAGESESVLIVSYAENA